jgi:hypothetical protein
MLRDWSDREGKPATARRYVDRLLGVAGLLFIAILIGWPVYAWLTGQG